MIQVTARAKQKLLSLAKEEGKSIQSLRVAVKSGGCSGLVYDLSFDEKILPEDKVYEDNPVKVIIDKKSLFYVVGTTLDFSDGLNGKGFHFVNPNAKRTCGCGESFAL